MISHGLKPCSIGPEKAESGKCEIISLIGWDSAQRQANQVSLSWWFGARFGFGFERVPGFGGGQMGFPPLFHRQTTNLETTPFEGS